MFQPGSRPKNSRSDRKETDEHRMNVFCAFKKDFAKRFHKYSILNLYQLVISQFLPFIVIPAKAGIQ
jgi:hypothetical protein